MCYNLFTNIKGKDLLVYFHLYHCLMVYPHSQTWLMGHCYHIILCCRMTSQAQNLWKLIWQHAVLPDAVVYHSFYLFHSLHKIHWTKLKTNIPVYNSNISICEDSSNWCYYSWDLRICPWVNLPLERGGCCLCLVLYSNTTMVWRKVK